MKIANMLSLLFAAALIFACMEEIGNDKDNNLYYPEEPLYSSHSSSSVEIKLQDSLRYQELSYKTIQIGSQIWLAQNLNAEPNSKKGAWWCTGDPYDPDDPEQKHINGNCSMYGKLYDWAAAMDVCPTSLGWRLPSKNDFDKLSDYLLGSENLLESPSWWNATLGGYRDESSGNYFLLSQEGYWWSSTVDKDLAYYSNIKKGTKLFSGYSKKTRGYSVRCVKDKDN